MGCLSRSMIQCKTLQNYRDSTAQNPGSDMFSLNGLDGLPATSATGQVPGYKLELRSTSMCANLVVESDHIVQVGNLCFERDLGHKWSHVSSSLLPILSHIQKIWKYTMKSSSRFSWDFRSGYHDGTPQLRHEDFQFWHDIGEHTLVALAQGFPMNFFWNWETMLRIFLDYFGDTYSIFNELHKGHRIPPKKMHVTESSWHCTSAILALHKRNRTPKNYRMRAAKSSHAKIVCQNNRTIGSAALLLNRVW